MKLFNLNKNKYPMVKAIHLKKTVLPSKKKTTLCMSLPRTTMSKKGSKIFDIYIKYSPHNTTQFLIDNQIEKRKVEENEEHLMVSYGTMIGKSPSRNLMCSDISISTNEDDDLSDVFDCVF